MHWLGSQKLEKPQAKQEIREVERKGGQNKNLFNLYVLKFTIGNFGKF